MYNHNLIEKKWLKSWEETKVHYFKEDTNKKKYFVYDAIPYPSGVGLHLGHIRAFVPGDIISRFKKMQGYNVLHATGWDAFGLPAEQFAITNGKHPNEFNEKNISYFRSQMKKCGFDYADNKEIDSTDPEYYKWTQWMFIQLYKKGLMEKKEMSVNWCPQLGTVLANDEIEEKDGMLFSERGGFPVEKKMMNQWVCKITKYGDKLIEGLEDLKQWPESLKSIQREWIGKSVGAYIDFICENGQKISVFTTRPDTIYGVTYIAIAPENNVVSKLVSSSQEQQANEYINITKAKSELERKEGLSKSGIFLGTYAVNPISGKNIPIYIADYVLNNYATGMVMGVPAHDQRDWDFAKTHKLDINFVIASEDTNKCFEEDGMHINSNELDGLNTEQAIDKMINILTDKNIGKKAVTYKLRDWIFSRQRFWGEPIPVLYDDNGNIIIEDNLPVKLPGTASVSQIVPSGTGASPLANISEWVNVNKNGKEYKRETDTMPGTAATSWLPLAFITKNDDGTYLPIDSAEAKERFARWMPGDIYICGQEHATGHLLYLEFWLNFMKDQGWLNTAIPSIKLINQGMILGPDGKKMSKSKGNTIDPMGVVESHGADALRIYESFMGPLTATLPWSQDGLDGSRKWLDRVNNFFTTSLASIVDNENELPVEFRNAFHKFVKKATYYLENNESNMAISEMMIYLNECYKNKVFCTEHLNGFISVLSCFAPFLSEELNSEVMKNTNNIINSTWPNFKEEYTIDKTINLPIQVNGKLRGTVEVNRDENEDKIVKLALELENIKIHLEGKEIKKIIYINNKILNLIV